MAGVQDLALHYRIILWSAVLIALTVGGFALAAWMKRRLHRTDGSDGEEGFTLSDLRKLHRNGHMTTEEFERAKSALLASINKRQKSP